MPVDETVTGVLSGSGSSWKVGSRVVDFGATLTRPHAPDLDGDGTQGSYAAELEGLAAAGLEVTVVLEGGTNVVISFQGQPW